MSRRFKKSIFKPKAESRIVIVAGASVNFEVREMKRLGEQNTTLGIAQIWGAFGPATASESGNVAGKFVGVRYRWMRGSHGNEEARLFDSETSARSFALAPVRKVKAAKVPQAVG